MTTTAESGNDSFSLQSLFGSLCWWLAGGIVVLKALEHNGGLPFDMLRSWHTHPHMWTLLALVFAFSGYQLLRRPLETADRQWQPRQRGCRFRSVMIYSRPDCHLCDQAKDTLLKYADSLPDVETIDISHDEQLLQEYGEAIPVVFVDGRERFRGRVDEFLLRRLIDASEPLLPIA